MSCLLRVDGVHFDYQGHTVLRQATFDLEEGSCSALIGTNGAGKTTLLRIAAGVLRPASGSVTLRGRPMETIPLKEIARTIALVPQQLELPFEFTVQQVVEQGRTPYIGMLRGPGRGDRDGRRSSSRPGGCVQPAPSHLQRAQRRRAPAGKDRPGTGAATPACCCSMSQPRTSISAGRWS